MDLFVRYCKLCHDLQTKWIAQGIQDGWQGYILIFLVTQFLVPLWGISPLLVALFILGMGMGLLMTPLLNKTLAGIAHHDAGAASGVFTTAMSTAGALGVAVIGVLDAAFTRNGGSPLHAFILSIAVIVLLSCVLLFTVRPLSKPLIPMP